MLRRMLKHIVVWAVIAPLAVAAHPAIAAPDERVTRTVAYNDLNLAHPHGRAVLERRIEQALDEVCGDAGRALFEQMRRRRCRAAARAGVSPQVERMLAEAGREVSAPMSLAARR